MVYVFVFLGEFGYELLNWQGVVRRFAQRLQSGDTIVSCSRTGLASLYESASHFVDIATLPLYRRSRAVCYFGTVGVGAPGRGINRAFDALLRRAVRRHVRRDLRSAGETRFVFSSSRTTLDGCAFGCDPERLEYDADIYDGLDVSQNVYRRLEADGTARATIERQLGFSLDEPYVLLQTRTRRVGPQEGTADPTCLVNAIAARSRVVLLSFSTGRALDSASRFARSLPGHHYAARTFPEQAELIQHASRCVFLTEGDFGAHLYVPPMMGRDVVAIAPRRVYALGTTPIDYWNQQVFRFGGAIRPRVAEDEMRSRAATEALVDELLAD